MTDIREFLKLEAAGGIVLVGAAALAMTMANSFFGGTYEAIFETEAGAPSVSRTDVPPES